MALANSLRVCQSCLWDFASPPLLHSHSKFGWHDMSWAERIVDAEIEMELVTWVSECQNFSLALEPLLPYLEWFKLRWSQFHHSCTVGRNAWFLAIFERFLKNAHFIHQKVPFTKMSHYLEKQPQSPGFLSKIHHLSRFWPANSHFYCQIGPYKIW